MVKKIISTISIILVILVSGTTIYKIVIRHNEKLYDVLYSEIKYQANKCFLEEKCKKNIILNELYEKGYLETKFDPVTKEELNRNLKIEITDNSVNILID